MCVCVSVCLSESLKLKNYPIDLIQSLHIAYLRSSMQCHGQNTLNLMPEVNSEQSLIISIWRVKNEGTPLFCNVRYFQFNAFTINTEAIKLKLTFYLTCIHENINIRHKHSVISTNNCGEPFKTYLSFERESQNYCFFTTHSYFVTTVRK